MFPQKIDNSDNPSQISSFDNNLQLSKCPKCGSQDIDIRRIIRKQRKSSRKVKRFVGKVDYDEIVQVENRINPLKAHHLTIFNELDRKSPVVNPVIGLPKYLPRFERNDVGNAIRESIKDLKEDIRFHDVPLEMLSQILTNPDSKIVIDPANANRVMLGFKVLELARKTAISGQWDRNIIEWIPICDTAVKKSLYAASREHYSIAQDGKKLYLSPKQIQRKIPLVCMFIPLYSMYATAYIQFTHELYELAKKDLRINEEAKKIELKYMRARIPYLIQNWKNWFREVQPESNEIFKNKDKISNGYVDDDIIHRVYFEIRHYDRQLYEEQKLKLERGERETKPDGRKYCCILSESGQYVNKNNKTTT